LLCVLCRELHQAGIEIDAQPARAALRCRDDEAPVARAEVDHEVAGTHFGHAHHALDDLDRRLDVRHRAVVPRPGLRLGCRGRDEQCNQDRAERDSRHVWAEH